MTRNQWLLVCALLGPVYAAAIAIAYWLYWPMPPTIQIIYSHPKFCYKPCENRNEAIQYEVDEVSSGTQYVWHYREIRINHQRIGSIRSSWQSGAFIWNSPQVATMGSETGVYLRATAVEPPTSNPTRDFVWKMSFHYDVTPLRNEDIVFPPVTLRVVKTP
jgi:hypothetical protein